MRLLTVTLASLSCLAVMVGPCEAQDLQPPAYLTSYYSSGSDTKLVTIKNKAGLVLSVLDIPAEIAVSLHLVSGQSNAEDRTATEVTFTGDVSIRARPRNELLDGGGGLRVQMMSSPLKLDLRNVVVVFTIKR